jgi:hypothetical protein
MTKSESRGGDVGLPPVVFFFTLDQIAGLLNISEDTLRVSYLYYSGRTSGSKPPRLMYAVNMAADPETDAPNWRVAHPEFVRWLRSKGYRIASLQIPK